MLTLENSDTVTIYPGLLRTQGFPGMQDLHSHTGAVCGTGTLGQFNCRHTEKKTHDAV